jgi:hypothetical protein
LDTLVKRNISYPCQESNPGHPARSQSLRWLIHSGSLYCCSYYFY